MLPYIVYFTSILDEQKIDYEFICWNRDGNSLERYNGKQVISVSLKGSIRNNNLRKVYDYLWFASKVKKVLIERKYDFIHVHTIPNAFFLKSFLIDNYRHKYIFDIRDYSPLYPFIKNGVKSLVLNSAFTSISSTGYLNWLPKNLDYVLSHNISSESVRAKTTFNNLFDRLPIRVLTIGQIRDYSSNRRVIESLGNKETFQVVFTGEGVERGRLEDFSSHRYNNILFTGRYEKIDEDAHVRSCDILSIVLPTGIAHNTPMANRFYLSLIFRRPMIVNVESIHSLFVKEYNLGIIVKTDDDIYEKINDYVSCFDFDAFNNGCIRLLKKISNEINYFEKRLTEVYKH